MEELVRYEVISLPRLLVVGKALRYSDKALNTGDNRLPGFWNSCYNENLFAPLEAQESFIFNCAHAGVFIDWDLGDGDFTYIVGILMRQGVIIPSGYIAKELEECEVLYCWIKSQTLMQTRTASFDPIAEAIAKLGRSCANMRWCADLYHPVRSLTPDEEGKVILDCYVPLDGISAR